MGLRNSKQKSPKLSFVEDPVISNKEYEDPVEAEAEAAAEVEIPKLKECEIDTKLVPTWVNEALFLDLLRENVKNFEKIIKFKAYPAMGAGENYATLMLRVSIEVELKDGSTEKVSFMMKVPHDNEQMLQMMEFFNIFVPENGMYFDVIPELEQMYKDAGQDITFAAKAYKLLKDNGKHYVLLDDLCPRGFKNMNRLDCLDLKHAEAVLKKMAQFHAVSATRVATKGAFADIFMNGFQNEQTIAIWQGIMSTFQTSFMNNIKLYKDGEKYYETMKTVFDRLMGEFLIIGKYNDEEFNVLNHGDSWSNNILFKHSPDGEITDTIYVDFQISKYGSPAQDLLYFIMSSVNIEIKLKRFDYFIRFYYNNLIENLKLLKYPKKFPTLRQLHMQLFKYGTWAVTTSVMTLPIVLLDPTDIASFDNFLSGDEAGLKFKQAMFSSKRYIRYISEILPWLNDRGLLEITELSDEEKAQLLAKPSSAEDPTKKEQITVEPSSNAVSEIPEWITEEYFVDILKQNIKGFKQLKKFEVSRATKAGDNYASLMLKVDIDVELEDGSIQPTSYMLKVAPASEQAKSMLAAFNTFQRELEAYDEVIPQLERIYKEAGVENVIFGPKSYHFTKNPGCDTVLMENMRPHGFQNADRLSGLDVTHIESVLQKLAQFHAASAYWIATGGKVPKFIESSIYTEESRAIMEPMGLTFYDLLEDCMKEYKGSEEYIHKIMKFKTTFFDIMIKANKIYESDFNVINHGDCWTNNILFQYNADGSIKNTYFVDYQMIKYGTPAQDLYYFLLSSSSLDVKVEKFDEFVEYYYKHLKQNLELLKYPKSIPTLEDIQRDVQKHGAWGLTTVIGVMGAVLLEPNEDANMDNMLGETQAGTDLRRLIYSNARYRSHAEVLYPWLNKRGILDLD